MSKQVQNVTLRVDVETNIKNAKSALESLGSAINGKLSIKGSSRFKNVIKNLEKDLDALQTKATKGFKGSSDAKEVLHEVDLIQKKIGKLDRMNFENMVDSNVINKLNNAASAIDKISDAKSRAAKNKALKEDLEATKKAIEGIELSSKTSMADFSGAFGKRGSGTYNVYRQQLEKYKKSLAEYEKEKAQAEKIMNSSENGSKEYTKAASDIEATEAKIAKLKSEFKDAFVNTGIKNIDGELKGLKTTISSIDPSAIKNAKAALTDLVTEMQNVAKNSNNADIKKFFEGFDASKIQNMSGDKLQTLFDKFKTMASELGDEEVAAKIKQIEKEFTSRTAKIVSGLDPIKDAAKGAYTALADTEAAQRSLKSLATRVEYFFSLTNGFLIAQRVIRSAFNTVKELDKAMTDTAVVTDNTVGDMWNKLDEYTARANQLGATTQGAYETATLYYQQGLDDQQAGELSVETMKMARIAGMDYAKATDSMTAALRGFNKELTAASAQNVNDVYSNLAAKTASNTQEISTAMEKVASLAHNAGMDLETTAVYLSQAIETTREAPENIGTAMKTILARFQSLTKDPDSLSPEVQEALGGETVDANVTEAALAKAGVALRDETGQFRAAKDVLLELNAVWNDLDKNTQRYIATQTAGARQQSRFIAMMQNNARTQELLGYAYDSEGASQKQFEKTLDSLEAKINKFKNAWNEFTMGIADSGMIKGAVDIITNLITVVNKLAKMTGPLEGFVKAFIAIGTFKAGGNLLIGGLQKFGLFKDFEKMNAKGLAGMMGQFAGNISGKKPGDFFSSIKGRAARWGKGIIDSYNSEKNLVIKNAEAASIEKVAIAYNKETAEILKNKIAKGSLSATDIQNIALSEAQAGANITEAGSFSVLTVKIREAAAAMWAFMKANPITFAVVAAVAAVGAEYYSVQKACERAEEASKAYNDSITEHTESIDSLKSIKEEFEALSEGVDSAGNNVDLSTDKYARYNEIRNQLAESFPEIVSGYDEEGNAILKAGTNIDDLIKQEQEAIDTTKALYATTSNLKDATTAAKEEVVINDNNRTGDRYGYSGKTALETYNNLDSERKLLNDQKKEREKLLEELTEKQLKGEGTSFIEKEIKLQEEAISTQEEKIHQIEGIKEAYSGVTDILKVYLKTLNGGEEIYNKNTQLANEWLQKIAMNDDLDESEKFVQVGQLISGGTQTASKTIDTYQFQVKKLREQLEDGTINEKEFNKSITKYYEEAKGKIEDAGIAEEDLKNSFIDSVDDINRSAESVGMTLKEAFNPFGTAIEQARGLKDTIDKISKTDFYSAGNTIDETIEGVTDAEDTWGYGSKSIWATGKELLSKDKYEKISSNKDIKGLISALKSASNYTSGVSEAQAFYDKLLTSNYVEKKEDGTLQFKDLEKLADEFGWSMSMLAAAMSNLEQAFPDGIEYGTDQVAKILSGMTEEQGVIKNGKQMAVTKDTLVSAGAKEKQVSKINKDNRVYVYDKEASGKETYKGLKEFGTFKGDLVDTNKELTTFTSLMMKLGVGTEDAATSMKAMYEAGKIDEDFAREKGWLNKDGTFNEAEFASSFDSVSERIEEPLLSINDAVAAIANKICGDNWDKEESTTKEPTTEAHTGSTTGKKEGFTDSLFTGYNYAKDNNNNEALTNYKQYKFHEFGNEQGLKGFDKANSYDALKAFADTDWEKFTQKFSKLPEEAQRAMLEEYKDISNLLPEKLGLKNAEFLNKQENLDKTQSVTNTYAKYGKQAAQEEINIHANIEDGNIDEFYNKINKLPTEKKTELITQIPQYALLLQYEEQIKELPEEKQTKVVAAVDEGNFDPNKEPWKSMINGGTDAESNLALTITTTGQKELDLLKKGWASFDANTKTLKVHTNAPEAEKKVNSLNKSIRNLKTKKVLNIEVRKTGISEITVDGHSWKISAAAKGKNLTSSAFGQNILGSAAKGAKRGRLGPRGRGGMTLTGELGPELVWEPSKGYSYITGADGPEMRNLSSDAVVWPADQTKKIMRTAANGRNVFGSAAKTGNTTGRPSFSSNSGSTSRTTTASKSKNSKTKTKNKNKNKGKNKKNNKKKQKYIKRLFDRWYNAALRFEKFQKKVELAEKKLENWRQYNFKTFEKVGQQFKDTITNLNNQILQAKAAQTAAKQQRTAAKKAKLRDSDGKVIKKKKISSYVKFDKDGMAYLTTKGLKLKDNKLGNAVKDYIENYNAAWEEEKKWEAQIIDLQKEMIEQLNKERDNYISLLERTRDALVQKIQKQIDKESKIIEAINDANSKLIDSMNKNLSKMRQDRDNKKTEEELQDKYAQLNAMKRIGSGANASDIKKLEKEIKDLEQNYTDSLVDQKISDFQEKNDSASQRKQTAIEIAQALLETRSENGYFNEEAIQMIKDAMADGIYNSDDALWKLLNEAENQNKTAVEIAKHTEEITSLLQGVFNYFNGAVKKGMQTQGYEGQKYAKFVDSKGNETNIMAGKEFTGDGTITNDNKKYTGVTFDTDGKYHYTGVEEVKTTSASNTSKPKSHAHGYLQKVDNKSYKRLSKSDKGYLVKGLNDLIADKKINAKKKDSLSTKVKAAEKKAGVKKPNGTWDAKGAKKIKKKFPKYATGGIADFTGPAWLDGTPSKPELILNAQDSKNFILLKDALSSISSGTVAPSGDNYYDISINVDKLSSDYDVDQVANKIKRMIVNDSKYRGVSSVRRSK